MDSQDKTSGGAAASVPDSGGLAPDAGQSVPPAVTDIQEAINSPSANAHVEQVMGNIPAAPPAVAPTIPPAAPPMPAATTDTPPPAIAPQAPQIADDNDLIEPEWVDSAKAIVERTHDDPYQQNKEISKLKADYMLKRYKKQIKVSEE
jgi:hypothetical protein